MWGGGGGGRGWGLGSSEKITIYYLSRPVDYSSVDSKRDASVVALQTILKTNAI